jgi:hypothetical protein
MPPLKGAQEVLDDFISAVKPPEPTLFALVERKPGPDHDFNWILSMGPLSGDAKTRYESKILEMRKEHRRLDWDGVTEREGEWRAVRRWVSN